MDAPLRSCCCWWGLNRGLVAPAFYYLFAIQGYSAHLHSGVMRFRRCSVGSVDEGECKSSVTGEDRHLLLHGNTSSYLPRNSSLYTVVREKLEEVGALESSLEQTWLAGYVLAKFSNREHAERARERLMNFIDVQGQENVDNSLFSGISIQVANQAQVERHLRHFGSISKGKTQNKLRNKPWSFVNRLVCGMRRSNSESQNPWRMSQLVKAFDDVIEKGRTSSIKSRVDEDSSLIDEKESNSYHDSPILFLNIPSASSSSEEDAENQNSTEDTQLEIVNTAADEEYARMLQEEEYMLANRRRSRRIRRFIREHRTMSSGDIIEASPVLRRRPQESSMFPATSRIRQNLSNGHAHRRIQRAESDYAFFPSFLVESESMASSSDPCSVCLEKFEKDNVMTKLPCFHGFHTPCIETWLKHGNFTCPVCRCDVFWNFR